MTPDEVINELRLFVDEWPHDGLIDSSRNDAPLIKAADILDALAASEQRVAEQEKSLQILLRSFDEQEARCERLERALKELQAVNHELETLGYKSKLIAKIETIEGALQRSYSTLVELRKGSFLSVANLEIAIDEAKAALTDGANERK